MLVRREADDVRELKPRLAIGALFVLGLLTVLIGRLYFLQVRQGGRYAVQSQLNYRKPLPLPADRGLIKDRDGRVLVDNRPSFDVFLTPAFCGKGKEREEVMARLANFLEMTPEDVERMHHDFERSLHSKDRLERFKPFRVQLDIPREQVDVIEGHRAELTCVDLIPSPHRSYQDGASLGQLMGYMSEVTQDELDRQQKRAEELHKKGSDVSHLYQYRVGQPLGRLGLERRWEEILRGVDGKELVAVDAKGRRLDDDTQNLLIPIEDRVVPATPGDNLVLSIDQDIQRAAETAFPGKAGAVVVMEAKTGFILGLVSRPSFDPNKMSGRITKAEMASLTQDPLKPMLNRAMDENYHPGSTFKVVTSLAALEAGVLSPSGTLYCNGGFTLGNHRWRCDKSTAHGLIDLKKALKISCDVFYYQLGDRLGLDPISKMAHALGYGEPTHFDVGREIAGLAPDSDWVIKTTGSYTKGHAVNASIGQGEINVTPLQQAVAYTAIANGGTVFIPQVVRRIEAADGKVVQDFAPKVARHLNIKQQNFAAVRAGLEAVVNEPGGTGYGVRLADVRVAGKTGTAQVVKLGAKQGLHPEQQAYVSRDHAWFASFAPADNPEIVVVVLNEHGGWGASGAAPTATKVIEAYFAKKRGGALVAAEGAAKPTTAPAADESALASAVAPRKEHVSQAVSAALAAQIAREQSEDADDAEANAVADAAKAALPPAKALPSAAQNQSDADEPDDDEDAEGDTGGGPTPSPRPEASARPAR